VRSKTGDLGGGDCDVTVDEGGRSYLADLWVGGVSISSTSDGGSTWRGVPASIGMTPLDRPWITGGSKDEVFVTAAQPYVRMEDRGQDTPPLGDIWVARSTDGGLTFSPAVAAASNEARLSLNSNLARDGTNLYLMFAKKSSEGKLELVVAISRDSGSTWEQRVAATQGFFAGSCSSPLITFPVVATDGAHGVYLAWALENPATNRSDLFMASSADDGNTWKAPVLVTDHNGTRAFPWIAAQGPGRVGLAWYETNATFLTKNDAGTCTWNAPSDAAWNLHYAFTTNAQAPEPAFHETLVQPKPIHIGQLGQYYAELLQLRYAKTGQAAIAYVADVAQGTARPMIAIEEMQPPARDP
jgi:hypothetical protein